MLHKVSISSCSEHCPQTLSDDISPTLIPIYPYCTAGKPRTWRTTACHRRTVKSWTVRLIHYMAEPKILLHFTERSPREERAPDSPASNGVLSNRVSISNWGLQTHCWVVLFHFLLLLPWLMVAVGSLGAHCTEHCLHPRTSSAWEAMLGHIVPGWQVCWAPTMSHLNGPGFMVIQRSLLGFSSPKACQKKHRRAKQRPQDSPFPGGRQKPKYGIGLGFMPCLLKEIPPHSPLSSLLPLAASFSWCLGTGLHSAP